METYGQTDNHAVGYSLLSYLCGYYRYYYPEEFIAAYMSSAANDEDVNTGKEMLKKYHIRITSPKFGQDNRGYFIDHVNHTISDALSSIKGVGTKDAEALLNISRMKEHTCFVDLLVDMNEYAGAVNSAVIDTLIRINYFDKFGTAGKLLDVYREFTSGEFLYKKTYVAKTKSARIEKLREIEASIEEKKIPVEEQIAFEINRLGIPISTFKERRGDFAVLEVDSKYSTKVKLYNIARGTVGTMRIKKDKWKVAPLKVGDVITVYDWKKSPAYQFSGGKSVINPNVYDQWLLSYRKVA